MAAPPLSKVEPRRQVWDWGRLGEPPTLGPASFSLPLRTESVRQLGRRVCLQRVKGPQIRGVRSWAWSLVATLLRRVRESRA